MALFLHHLCLRRQITYFVLYSPKHQDARLFMLQFFKKRLEPKTLQSICTIFLLHYCARITSEMEQRRRIFQKRSICLLIKQRHSGEDISSRFGASVSRKQPWWTSREWVRNILRGIWLPGRHLIWVNGALAQMRTNMLLGVCEGTTVCMHAHVVEFTHKEQRAPFSLLYFNICWCLQLNPSCSTHEDKWITVTRVFGPWALHRKTHNLLKRCSLTSDQPS